MLVAQGKLHGGTFIHPDPDTTIVEHCPFPKSSSPAEEKKARAELITARAHERKLKKRYRRAVCEGGSKSQQNALKAILCSKPFLVCAAVDANKVLPFARRVSLEDAIQIGLSLNWKHIPAETVLVTAVPKPKAMTLDDFRTYCDFGIRHRAMQLALCKLVAPFFVPKSFQYEYRKKNEVGGVRAAIRHARAEMLNGNVWAATLDIKQFFPSFDGGKIAAMLPLLKKVLIRFASGEHLNVVINEKSESTKVIMKFISIVNILYQARRGGPQGSTLSPLLGGLIISQLNWDSSLVLINWVDDFLILGPSQEAVEAAANALIAKITALPGGHFMLKQRSFVHAKQAIVFLGHSLSLAGDKVVVRPAHPDNLWAAMAELDERTSEYVWGEKRHLPNAKLKVLTNLVKMIARIKGWQEAFAECDRVEEEVMAAVAMGPEQYCQLLNLPLDDLVTQTKAEIVDKWWYE